MDQMTDLVGLKISHKLGWLWSLFISALALSGNAREAFDVIEQMELKGMMLSLFFHKAFVEN